MKTGVVLIFIVESRGCCKRELAEDESRETLDLISRTVSSDRTNAAHSFSIVRFWASVYAEPMHTYASIFSTSGPVQWMNRTYCGCGDNAEKVRFIMIKQRNKMEDKTQSQRTPRPLIESQFTS